MTVCGSEMGGAAVAEKGVRSAPVPGLVCAMFFPKVIDAARRCGYAAALHGSISRDIDIVVVPWTEDAADPDTLIRAIKEAVGDIPDLLPPEKKPHGRLAYVVGCWASDGVYLDISVMPRGGSCG